MKRARSYRRRGTASIEAVMGMGVLILLWAGSKYIAHLHLVSLQAKAKARGCAWQIAASACQNVPAGCASDVEEGESPESGNELSAASDEAVGDEGKTSAARERLGSEIDGMFKKRTTAHAGYEVTSPAYFGQKKDRVERSFTLPCNTKPQTFEEAIKGLFQKLMGNFSENESGER